MGEVLYVLSKLTLKTESASGGGTVTRLDVCRIGTVIRGCHTVRHLTTTAATSGSYKYSIF